METTFTEQFNEIKKHIAEKALESPAQAHNYKNTIDKLKDPELRKAFEDYSKESQKTGIFTNKDKVLEKHLANIYHINIARVFDKNAADRMVKDMGQHIKFEAKSLNSGDRNYSTEVAAKEMVTLRDQIKLRDKQIGNLTVENSSLKTDNNKLQQWVTNLSTELKKKLGYSQEQVNAVKMGHSNEKTTAPIKTTEHAKPLNNGMSM